MACGLVVEAREGGDGGGHGTRLDEFLSSYRPFCCSCKNHAELTVAERPFLNLGSHICRAISAL